MEKSFLKIMLATAFALSGGLGASAQKYSVSTDVLGYAELGTLNAEFSLAASQHLSATASARYNPFSFGKDDDSQVRYRQQSYSAGVRYWPWHVYSGWWMAFKMRYQEYNTSGIFSKDTREGDRYGGGLSAGYTYMLHKRLNLEFGLGLWGGLDSYSVYDCPTCGLTVDSGSKYFILPSDASVGISYVF